MVPHHPGEVSRLPWVFLTICSRWSRSGARGGGAGGELRWKQADEMRCRGGGGEVVRSGLAQCQGWLGWLGLVALGWLGWLGGLGWVALGWLFDCNRKASCHRAIGCHRVLVLYMYIPNFDWLLG